MVYGDHLQWIEPFLLLKQRRLHLCLWHQCPGHPGASAFRRAFLASIPNCVMGGVCVTLYGFIAVSGLKMIQKVNLGASKNLFVVAVILITGIGGLTLSFGKVTLTSIACALILGIITNLLLAKGKED